jgi:hypothetical protein
VPEDKPSKMSRLIQRDTIRGTPEDLEHGHTQLDGEMRTPSEENWGSQTLISCLDTNIAIFLHSGSVDRLTPERRNRLKAPNFWYRQW